MVPVKPEDFDYIFQPSRLKTLREKLGLTQSEMAVLLDMPVNTLSRWERGSNSPDANALAAIYSIAHERGVSPQFFVRRPSPVSVRMKRETLVFQWDFQNRAVDSRYVSEEWSYMELYMKMLFPKIDKSIKVAYTSDWNSHPQLQDSGFKVNSSWHNADSQIISEGRSIFDISDNSGTVASIIPAILSGNYSGTILGASSRTLSPGESFNPKQSVYTLISNDGDYTDFLKELRQAGVETFIWGTDECNERLIKIVGQDHFLPWERPYVTVKCMEVVRALNGRAITKGEFGNQCKKTLEETDYEIFPEDAGFSPKRPYASVLKHMELNGLYHFSLMRPHSIRVSPERSA